MKKIIIFSILITGMYKGSKLFDNLKKLLLTLLFVLMLPILVFAIPNGNCSGDSADYLYYNESISYTVNAIYNFKSGCTNCTIEATLYGIPTGCPANNPQMYENNTGFYFGGYADCLNWSMNYGTLVMTSLESNKGYNTTFRAYRNSSDNTAKFTFFNSSTQRQYLDTSTTTIWKAIGTQPTGSGILFNLYVYQGDLCPLDDVLSDIIDIIKVPEKVNYNFSDDVKLKINSTTFAGVAVNGSNCSLTVENQGIEIKSNITATINFSLCGSGCNYSSFDNTINFGSVNLVSYDMIHFKICHKQLAQGNINIIFSCNSTSQTQTITPNKYELCSDGFTTLYINSSFCKNTINPTFEIEYTGISNRQKTISNVEYDRIFINKTNTYPSDIVYNTTTTLWELKNIVEWYTSGTKKLFANCTNGNTLETINILSSTPYGNVSGVYVGDVQQLFYDNHTIEFYNGTWGIIYDAVDFENDLSIVNLTVKNSSGFLICEELNFNGNCQNISSNYFIDFVESNYTISLYGKDIFNNTFSDTETFFITDTISPVCSGLTDGTLIINNNNTITGVCTDESFFSIDIVCTDGTKYNVSGINAESYTYAFYIIPNTSTGINCTARYCDAHTDNLISADYDLKQKSSDKTEYLINNKLKIKLNNIVEKDLNYFNFIYDIDRYKWDVSTKTKLNYLDFYINTGGQQIYYLENKKYDKWLVVGNNWIDFKNDNFYDVEYTQKGYDFAIVRAVFDSSDDKITFSSIGELNCRDTSFRLSVTEEVMILNQTKYDVPFKCKTDTTADTIMYVLFCAFPFFLVIFNKKYLKNNWAVNVFSALIFILMGFSLSGCSIYISVFMILIGIIVFFI